MANQKMYKDSILQKKKERVEEILKTRKEVDREHERAAFRDFMDNVEKNKLRDLSLQFKHPELIAKASSRLELSLDNLVKNDELMPSARNSHSQMSAIKNKTSSLPYINRESYKGLRNPRATLEQINKDPLIEKRIMSIESKMTKGKEKNEKFINDRSVAGRYASIKVEQVRQKNYDKEF